MSTKAKETKTAIKGAFQHVFLLYSILVSFNGTEIS
jgi:hypothetical protein